MRPFDTKIYGLSGRSGTGKSYNAMELCGRLHIPAIIDDGLFIYGNNIVAGVSAKKQQTKIGAVRTALFMSDSHCAEVRAAVRRTKPDSILVLGTSDRMIYRICERLGLPEPAKIIYIEDIVSKKALARASMEREHLGTHVIPAPTFQVKRRFSGYFLDPKLVLKHIGLSRPIATEKTVVRPSYSYMGSYEISDKVISDIIEYAAKSTPGVAEILGVLSDNSDESMYIKVILQFDYGAKVRTAAMTLQKTAFEAVEHMTNFNVSAVDIEIRGFKFK